MKFLFISLILVLQATAQEPPKTFIVSRYNHLWQNSPMTDPPPPPEKEEKNDLEDWVLVGLAKYKDGPQITLVNKKDTKQRIRIPGGRSEIAREFRILEVKADPSGSASKTEVVLQKGPHRGTVTFDKKYLTIRKAPTKTAKAKTPTSAAKKTPPGFPGGTPKKPTNTTPSKAPRTRYIPKPKK